MIKLQDIKSTTVEILVSIALIIALAVIVPNPAKAANSTPEDIKALMMISAEAGECMSATTMLISFGEAGEQGREVYTRFILPYWEAYAREAGAESFQAYLQSCEVLVSDFAAALNAMKDVNFSI